MNGNCGLYARLDSQLGRRYDDTAYFDVRHSATALKVLTSTPRRLVLTSRHVHSGGANGAQ